MRSLKSALLFPALLLVAVALAMVSCDEIKREEPKSEKGVKIQTASVETGSDGFTTEQRNIQDRRETEGKIGSVKHLYVISPTTGKIIMYSTVIGKVTSSGKRLYPKTQDPDYWGFEVTDPRGVEFRTNEVLDAAGTYGHSSPYITWRDGGGNWRKLFLNTQAIITVTDVPIRTTEISIDLTVTDKREDEAREDATINDSDK